MEKFLEQFFDSQVIAIVLSSKKYRRISDATHKKGEALKKIDPCLCEKLYWEFKLPIYKIAMLYGASDATIARILRKNNVEMKGHMVGKNSQNHYFQNIDNKEKAYFLGLMIADGSIVEDKRSETRRSKNISISLTQSDAYILERFNTIANFQSEVKLTHCEDKKPRAKLSISSIAVYDDLERHGLQPNKSIKQTFIPGSLNKKYLSHIVRGYFDGDGISKSNGYIGFCGSNIIVHQIRDLLCKELGIRNNTVTYNKSNHIWYVQWAAKNDVLKIYNYLYKDANNLYIERKRLNIHKRLQALYSENCIEQLSEPVNTGCPDLSGLTVEPLT